MAVSEEFLKRKDELLCDDNEVELPSLSHLIRFWLWPKNMIYWQNLLGVCNRRKCRIEVRLNSKAMINWLSQQRHENRSSSSSSSLSLRRQGCFRLSSKTTYHPLLFSRDLLAIFRCPYGVDPAICCEENRVPFFMFFQVSRQSGKSTWHRSAEWARVLSQSLRVRRWLLVDWWLEKVMIHEIWLPQRSANAYFSRLVDEANSSCDEARQGVNYE